MNMSDEKTERDERKKNRDKSRKKKT
jgi:hypothetical protein